LALRLAAELAGAALTVVLTSGWFGTSTGIGDTDAHRFSLTRIAVVFAVAAANGGIDLGATLRWFGRAGAQHLTKTRFPLAELARGADAVVTALVLLGGGVGCSVPADIHGPVYWVRGVRLAGGVAAGIANSAVGGRTGIRCRSGIGSC
jgi:hypothetical protein